MYSQVTIFNLVFFLVLQPFLYPSQTAFAKIERANEGQKNEGQKNEGQKNEGQRMDRYDHEYEKLIREEEEKSADKQITERLASGIAALVIGLYGYYNDDHGTLTKVAYGATQTAGVFMISGAILDANQPSLLVLVDKYLQKRGEISHGQFKRGIVQITQRRQMGEYKKLAYSSAILSLMYAYDGYREKKNSAGLANVFYFLSFNFMLVSGASFYKISRLEKAIEAIDSQPEKSAIYFNILPMPHIVYVF